MNCRRCTYSGAYDSKKEKDRLSDIILGRVGLMGNFLSDPVSTSPEPPVDTPDRERRSRAAEMTSPEEYKRRFPLPSPRSGRPCTLTGGCTAVSPCWSGPPVAAASRVSSSGCWASYGGAQGGYRRAAR